MRSACPCCEARPRRALFAAVACVLTAPKLAAAAGATRRLAIERVQTGETFDGVFWRDGRHDRAALRQLDWVFRDPSAEEATPMDPRLFDLLHAMVLQLDSQERYQVISGYRAPETNAARARQSRNVSTVSLHMSGMAADVKLPDRASLGLARLAAEANLGGVGLYRRDGFVHLDCGPARRW
jgi:uncharacterized protein YcbK (DUF882 family)